MSKLSDHIYEMHGTVSSMKSDIQTIKKTLDYIKHPGRTCTNLDNLKVITLIIGFLTLVNMFLNPVTRELAKSLIKLIV